MAFWQNEPYQTQITEVFDSNDHVGAMRLVKEFWRLVDDPASGVNEQNIDDYHALEAKLKAVAMHHLSEQMLVELFEAHTVDVLDLPETVDLIEHIKLALINHLFLEDRNALRAKIREAILRCRQTLGSGGLMLGTETVEPSVQNWLKTYISDVGNEPVTALKLARFFAQNKGVQRLSPPERLLLRRLIDLFEFLKRPSEDMAVFEEDMVLEDDNGNVFELVNGKMKPFYTKEDFEDLRKQARERTIDRPFLWSLMARYPDEFKEFAKYKVAESRTAVQSIDPATFPQKVKQFIESQRTRFAHRVAASGVPLPNRTAALVAMLHKAVQGGKEADMVLAKEILQFTLADQERLANFMRHSSISKLIADEFPAEMGDQKEAVAKSPVSPAALQTLLMIIFGKKFGLSKEEAIWQSFDVIQKIPHDAAELKTVVTYDPAGNKLVWRYEA
ncbi:MAG: hypothetical protein HY461_00575 [Parcubacteria group bacterium]|nr:hypothetical protein [Parcubacteria group bacterium]